MKVHRSVITNVAKIGYSVALDIYGRVYSWGASACGQLGISSIKDLPTDLEGFPYQPIPTLIESLSKVCIVQIATGDAHCVARSAEGKLYSWGGGGCGQLGHPDTHLMPKDEDGCAYLPVPLQIELLKDFCVKEVVLESLLKIGGCREGTYSCHIGRCRICLFLGSSCIGTIRTS